MNYEQILAFHGHSCPGLAIGYRMSLAGMDALAATQSPDEQLVAIVENDACGVDALQCVTGCTFGKGNLIFHDYGKQVYTIYCRESKRGFRIVFHGKNMPEKIKDNREKMAEWILSAPAQDMLDIMEANISEPEPARIHQTIICDMCGEGVMATRIKPCNGKKLCIPCYQKLTLKNK